MPLYSSWDAISKPFVEGYFMLPKAIGRTAIRDGLAIREAHDAAQHNHSRGDRKRRLADAASARVE